MEMRKCKECGKMFQPKGREQYCSDIHYRPCPVCGKPVIAKYLSDPARRCDTCKGVKKASESTNVPAKLVQPNKFIKFNVMKSNSIFGPSLTTLQKTEVENKAKEFGIQVTAKQYEKEIPARVDSTMFCANVDGKTFRFVRSQSLLGWQSGHIYTLKVVQDNSAYVVTTIFDNTLGREIEFNGRNTLQIRCTSQLSFYNYFQPVWQDAEEAV